MASFYGSPWTDVGDAGASAFGSMPSAFLRMQLLRQQIGEAQARQRLYGAETEYQRARTESERQLHEQSVQEAIRKATSNEAFGNAMRRLLGGVPSAGVETPVGPALTAGMVGPAADALAQGSGLIGDFKNRQLGEAAAAIPGMVTTQNPAQLGDLIQALTTLSSSGAMTDPTRALMLEGRKDPFVSGTGGWANVLTGQTGLIPQGPMDAMETALKQSQIDLNKARTKAASKEQTADKSVGQVFLRAYAADFHENQDQDSAEEAGSKAVETFLKLIAKQPKEEQGGETNAPEGTLLPLGKTPPGKLETLDKSPQGSMKKLRRYNPATDSFE